MTVPESQGTSISILSWPFQNQKEHINVFKKSSIKQMSSIETQRLSLTQQKTIEMAIIDSLKLFIDIKVGML